MGSPEQEPVLEIKPDEGGDPACWAGLLCPECGAVLDGGSHRPGCRLAAGRRPSAISASLRSAMGDGPEPRSRNAHAD